MCSLSEGQETVSQWMQSIDDLIKPRAKSPQDYSDVLGLINLFGPHLRFGIRTRVRLWPHMNVLRLIIINKYIYF